MEHKAAKAREKGGAFKLHCHPRDYFDDNPYYSRRGEKSLNSAF